MVVLFGILYKPDPDPGPGPLEKSDPGPLEKADPPLFRPQLGTWHNSMVLNSNPLPIL